LEFFGIDAHDTRAHNDPTLLTELPAANL